ncbi:hypothetical protein GL50803_0016273 [Giardia duodenalis]|uniref:Uncharacterized protein n=1 Tax=Giardia intestinalis (strain ATCC 50803 / WB clone C6) TaxID=184922 RepID=A8BGH9_GIAIC|nr:hypothetical protein GL50803_0016273 [Giardia intestinalis]KAE8302170.1 hypothetical protein GL50803_0016273 [Giardia intestinalis]|eukprot:XP_001707189.1 Hypothetical protein GL50803_16273 [Giardia lamblia ATCC 50803]
MASTPVSAEPARPYLEPVAVYGLNLAVRTPLFFTEDHQKVCFIAGRMIILHNIQTNTYDFVQLDGTINNVVHLAFSVTRRLLAFVVNTDNMPKIHIYSLRHKARVAMINVPDGQGLSGIVTSISFSLEDRFLLVQLAPPEWPIIVWAIPPFINENASMHGDIKPIKNVYVVPKPYALFKSQREISASYFSPLQTNVIHGIAPQNMQFLILQDGLIKAVSIFSLKRMVGTFMAPVVMRHQDKEFSLLPIKQTGEILVLRKDHLCCFIPSDMIFGQIVLRDPIFETTSQQYGKMTRFTIRNHLDVLSADPNVREEITCLKLLQDDMIMVGSSFGRIIIYQILNFEPPVPSAIGTDLPGAQSSITGSSAGAPSDPRQEHAIMMPCKASGGMTLRLPILLVLRSILLPCNFNAVLSVDICPKTRRVLVYTDAGYVFVSNSLTRDSILHTLDCQQRLFMDEFKTEQANLTGTNILNVTVPMESPSPLGLNNKSFASGSALRLSATSPPSSSTMLFKQTIQNSVTTEILALAYETIKKIRYLIRIPRSISNVYNMISLINPIKALTGTVANVKPHSQATQLETEFYQSPQTWPSAIISTSIFCPFTSYYQIPSTIVASVAHQGVTLNGVLMDPSQCCTGYSFGQELHMKGVPITAISASDETGYVAIGNDNGEVTVLNAISSTFVAAWSWALPAIYFENKRFDTVPEPSVTKLLADSPATNAPCAPPSQFNRSTLQLTNASAPSENAFDGLAVTNTTNEVTKTDLFSASAQNQANTPDANSQETMATTDFVMKTVESLRGMPAFTITSLKLHPSGRHLLVSARSKRDLGFSLAQEKPSRTAKANKGYCVCILHIVDSYMECISVIDCDSPCLGIDFDKTGNYLYLLSYRSVYVFSFLEIRLVKRINLSQRFAFLPRPNDFPSFSPQDMQKYKQSLQLIKRDAKPTCMAISTRLLVAVAFTDGDVCLFSSLDGALLNRYLTGGFFFNADLAPKAQQPVYGQEQRTSPLSNETVTEATLREEFDKLAEIDSALGGKDRRQTGINPILKKRAATILSTYVTKLSFIEALNFSPQGRSRFTATQGDKLAYTPLLAILADGTAVELDFLQQMWTIGRLGHRPDDGKIDLVSLTAAKLIGQLVPSTTSTEDRIKSEGKVRDTTRGCVDVPENPADNPLLAEYDNSRFSVTPTFPRTIASSSHNSSTVLNNTDTLGMVSTKGILGRTTATVGSSATHGERRGAFSLPVTAIYQLYNSQYPVAINEDNYLSFEMFKATYLNSLSLTHGIEAYSSWVKLTPPIITEAINETGTRAMLGKFLNDEGVFNSLLMNPHLLNATSTLIVSGSVTGTVVLHPYPVIDQVTGEYKPTHYNTRLHGAPVSHTAIVRGSYIVSCSVDGMILISRIRYPGLPFMTKPVPRSSLGLNHIVRSRKHQETLDLLFFELLTRTLLMKQASLTSIYEITHASETQLKQLMERFFEAKKDSVKALSGAFMRRDRMLKRRTEIMIDRDMKQNVLLRELVKSFEEQLSSLQYEKNRLIERLIHNEESHGNQIKELKIEMEESVQKEKLLTKKTTEDLQAQLNSLFEDERLLRDQTEQCVDEANKSLETEVMALKMKFLKTVTAEVSNVSDLRASHKELEKEFANVMKDTSSKKTALTRARTESGQALQALRVAKDTLEHLKADIVDRNATIAEKGRVYQSIQKEKVDLEKVGMILKNRSSELKECIAPRDNLLAELATQANEMDAELLRDQQKRYESNLTISELRLRRQGLSKELANKKEKIVAAEESILFILNDIQNIYRNALSNEAKGKELESLRNGSKVNHHILAEALKISNSNSRNHKPNVPGEQRASSTSDAGSPFKKVHVSTAYTMATSIVNSGNVGTARSFQLSPQRRSVSSMNTTKSSARSGTGSGRSSVLETRHLDMTGSDKDGTRNRRTASAASSAVSSATKGSDDFTMTAIAQALSRTGETVKDIYDTSIKYMQLVEQEREFHTKCTKGISNSIHSLYLKHCCENSKSSKSLLSEALELRNDPLTQVSTLLSTQKTIMSDEMLARQRTYLERSVATLEKSLERQKLQLSQAIEKARLHSSELLALSNLMRRENKRLQQQLRAAKLELIKKRQSSALYQSADPSFSKTVSKAVIQIEDEIRQQTEKMETDSTEDTLGIFDEAFKRPIGSVSFTTPGNITSLDALQLEPTELEEYLNTNFPISRSPSPSSTSPQPPGPPQFLTADKPVILPTLPARGREASDSSSNPIAIQSRPGSRLENLGIGELHESSEISGISSKHISGSARVSLPPLARVK